MSEIKITDKSGVKLLTKDKYCTEDINVTLDASNLRAENVKEGVSVLGVTGTLQPGIDGVSIQTGGNTPSGKPTLMIDGEKQTAMVDYYYMSKLSKSTTIDYPQSNTYTFSNGDAKINIGYATSVNIARVTGSNSIAAENLAAENIKSGINILGHTGTYKGEGGISGVRLEDGELFIETSPVCINIYGTQEDISLAHKSAETEVKTVYIFDRYRGGGYYKLCDVVHDLDG